MTAALGAVIAVPAAALRVPRYLHFLLLLRGVQHWFRNNFSEYEPLRRALNTETNWEEQDKDLNTCFSRQETECVVETQYPALEIWPHRLGEKAGRNFLGVRNAK